MFSQETSSGNDEDDSFITLRSAQSHQPSVSQGHSSSFLPGYLLGDSHSHHHPVPNSWLWPSEMNYGQRQKEVSSTWSMSRTPSGQDLMKRKWIGGKAGGPPVKGLYFNFTAHDTSDTSSLGYSRTHLLPAPRKIGSSTSAPPTTGGPHEDLNLQMMNETLPVSQVQNDPSFNEGDLSSEDVIDETWVTIFGFPPSAASFILQQFSWCGTILKHTVVPECNWMHIQYSSKMQARKALSNDGKVYAGMMKIGVIPCTEKSVMEERKCESLDKTVTYSPGLSLRLNTHMRPLTAAYMVARKDYEVVKDKPTPKRDAGIFSKLKEYMFGY